MFGPKMSTVFASRWNAIWWSGMVLLTAYCSVPSPQSGASSDKHQAEANTGSGKKHHVHKNDGTRELRKLSEITRKVL
jgi:hypothetical protein